MAFMNLGVNKHTHCEHGVVGSFRAPVNWVFTDQQVLGPTLDSNFLLCVMTHYLKILELTV